jgi:hypothetical protein
VEMCIVRVYPLHQNMLYFHNTLLKTSAFPVLGDLGIIKTEKASLLTIQGRILKICLPLFRVFVYTQRWSVWSSVHAALVSVRVPPIFFETTGIKKALP